MTSRPPESPTPDGGNGHLVQAEPAPARLADPSGAETAPPMTKTLLARLFLVPAILVSMLVVGLMTVVLLFGWPGLGQRPPLSKLLDDMESGGGDRQLGVALLPRDKEVWLAAQELAERLKQRDKELKPEEIGPLADRLSSLYQSLSRADPMSQGQRLLAEFTLLALARLDTTRSVDTLTAALEDRDATLRQTGLRGLVEMRTNPATRSAVAAVVRLLDDPTAEVRIVACAALGQIAPRDDRRAIDALAEKLSQDRESQWNAALALGRLGSTRGKGVLLSMLSRGEWERTRVQYLEDGRQVDRPLTPERISQYMCAAIQASAGLGDADLHKAIEALRRDSSVAVKQCAMDALKEQKNG